MAGALMQLVAYGAQDVYLTGNPQITFFKVVYRRHTNFAMESMEQTLNGTSNFGNRVVCKVSRNGDLLGPCYVETSLPAQNSGELWVNRVGFRLLKQVELRIGGQMIDRHYSLWMHVWTELTYTSAQKSILGRIIGQKAVDGTLATEVTQHNLGTDNGSNSDPFRRLHIPLMFSFCRNPGLALPLIALQYHEVEIHIEFSSALECSDDDSTALSGDLSDTSLWCDYMFLDTEERKTFAQNPHEYLIETVQTQESSVTASSGNNIRLNFNHPVKELMWVVQQAASAHTGDKFTNFCDATSTAAGTSSNVTNAQLKLNGQDRFAQRVNDYFNYVQPYQHHTGKPDLGINCYSFALTPEDHQPSGTCNFSRIDNAELNMTSRVAGTATVMAHGYNVLRVASGMGGLAYSN
jgi:hypothetical protein